MNSTPHMPAGFSVRTPTMADAQAVLALMNACDVAEYGEPDSELEDFIFDWERADLPRDGWLIEAPSGSLAAYGLVSTWSAGFDVQCVAMPDLHTGPLQQTLLMLAEQRVREMRVLRPEIPPLARVFTSHHNTATRQALAAEGFRPEKYHFRMQIDQTQPPPKPVWPADCQLRTVHPGKDDETLHGFIQRAFDQPGRTPQPFVEWRDYMMRPDHFEPDLWFLLTSGGEIVGAALCFDYEPYGWVRHLAVKQTRRRQGIGLALLRHVFGVFYTRGQMRVALGVEAVNENAYRLYKQAGMRRVRQFDEYHKNIA